MKKLINKLGMFGTIIVPVVTVISCGKSSQSDEVTSPSLPTEAVVQKTFSEPFKQNDQIINVLEDGIYLSKSDYQDGVIWNGKTLALGSEETEPIVKLGVTDMGLDNSLMFGNGDSLYVLYDQDDSDQMSPDTFLENLYFIDTSIASSLVEENVKIGNLRGSGWGGNYVAFTKSIDGYRGKLNPYFGSQNNHMTTGAPYADRATFDAAILNLRKSVGVTYPESFQKVLDYYGVMINNQNQVVTNPSITGSASLSFAPVFSATPIFTYERVATNAYKITYNFDNNSRITAAHFLFKKANETTGEQYGSLSLGDKQEWDSYYRHDNAKYQAVKNVLLEEYIAANPKPAPQIGSIPFETWKSKAGLGAIDWWTTKQINGERVVASSVSGGYQLIETATYTYKIHWAIVGSGAIFDGLYSTTIINKADKSVTPITDMTQLVITD